MKLSHRNPRPTGTTAESSEKLTIGLDFGTSNTSMARSSKTKVEILLNDRREPQTPSIVAFDGHRILIGDETKASSIKTENIIFGMKRLLGRTYEEFQKKNYPVQSFGIENKRDKPMILVDGKQLHVEQIVAILFSKLKETIERDNKVLRGAVLTVPSSFGPSQHRALMDAAEIAEITVLQSIEETTAAAIAFACKKKEDKSRNVLIFQLGGGSIDVAVFRIAGHSIELLSSVASGDVGGEDFTQQIVDFVSEKPHLQNANNFPKTRMQIRTACEKAKEDLTLGKETKIKLDTSEVEYSRRSFDRGNNKLLKIVEWMINSVITRSNLKRNEIDNYFVTGRSTMMPSIKKILKERVGDSKKKKDIINPGDGAVFGAALLASFLTGQSEMNLRVSSNVRERKITIVNGRVHSSCDQLEMTLQNVLEEIKKHTSSNDELNLEFVVRTQVALGFFKEELNEMAKEVKERRLADKKWLADDGGKIKLSEDIHKIEDQIKELMRSVGTDNDLEGLWKDCQSLDNWIGNAENLFVQDLEEGQKKVGEMKKTLDERRAVYKTKVPKIASGYSSQHNTRRTQRVPPPTKAATFIPTSNAHARTTETRAIGIDLGTTNSCVAFKDNGKVKVIQNEYREELTPSCVAFAAGRTLIGKPAKDLMVEEPKNMIYSIKRIIGRRSDDRENKTDMKRWQFKIAQNGSGRPLIKIDHRKETYYPEEISGLVLDYMRRIACKELDEDVRDAVVTVPAYFNHMQRTATKTAAELAGLNVLRIMNEPTAAAIAFGLVEKHPGNHTILVYDFGGGTFDVTILRICGTEFNVIASSGSTRLGGDDLTNNLVGHLVNYMKTEMGRDITNDGRAMNKLWVECEKAKIDLSSTFEYKLQENIADGCTLKKTIQRAKFESLNEGLFDKTMHYVKEVIKESGVEKKDIQYVVPVGGSCRIPHVIRRLKMYFGEDLVKHCNAPELAVAKGAAFYADYKKNADQSEDFLSEITPLSLGVKLKNENTSVIIKKNAVIPAAKNVMHCNSRDNQENASIQVCQGEKLLFKQNEYLEKFRLTITPKPRHEAKIDIKFSLNYDGILHAEATDVESKGSMSKEIDLCGTLDKLDIHSLKVKLSKLTEKENETEKRKENKLQAAKNFTGRNQAINSSDGSGTEV